MLVETIVFKNRGADGHKYGCVVSVEAECDLRMTPFMRSMMKRHELCAISSTTPCECIVSKVK